MSLVNDKSGTYCAQQANKTILGNLYSTIWIAMKANNCPLLVVTFVLLLSMASVWPVESSWTGELHRNEHRSALNTLKELDKYYAQVARPRFVCFIQFNYNPLNFLNPTNVKLNGSFPFQKHQPF